MGTQLLEGQLYRFTYKPVDTLAIYADVPDYSRGFDRMVTRSVRVQGELFTDEQTGASLPATRTLVVAAEQGFGTGWLADPDEMVDFHDAMAVSDLPAAHFDCPPCRASVNDDHEMVAGDGMAQILRFELVGQVNVRELRTVVA